MEQKMEMDGSDENLDDLLIDLFEDNSMEARHFDTNILGTDIVPSPSLNPLLWCKENEAKFFASAKVVQNTLSVQLI